MVIELGDTTIKKLAEALDDAQRRPEPLISKERLMELMGWTESQVYQYNHAGLPHTNTRPVKYLYSEVMEWIKKK